MHLAVLEENMSAVVFLTLLFVSFLSSSYFASGAFIDFRLITDDPNHLTLECYSSLTGDVDLGATINFFNSASDGAESHGSILSGQQSDLTADNEAFLRCASGGNQSNFVAIAAVPSDSVEETRTMNVFDGVFTDLTCPIPLGNLYDHLVPYTYSWDTFNAQNFAIPVDPSQYSNNNRTLSIFVNSTTRSMEYLCKLRLRRCDITRSNGSPRCQPMSYVGPRTRFEVYERSRVISPPVQQEIHVNEMARFMCVGDGSFINISWQYDEVCSNRSCEGAVVVIEVVSEEGRQRQISSTLEIDTSMLQLEATSGGEYSTTIGCILHQIVPPQFNLQGRDNQTFVARLVILNVPTSIEPPTDGNMTTTPTIGMPTTNTGSNLPVDSTNRIWIIAVTVIIVVVIMITVAAFILVLTILKRRHKKGKYYPSDSPDIDPTVPHKPYRVYEELPESVFITAGIAQCPLRRQNGIEYDQSNPKADNFSRHGSEDHCSKSGGGGSDLSGLSGVSGNIPGAHKMPTYSHDNSVMSETHLLAPQSWDKRYSDSTVNTRHTQSTIVPPTYYPDQVYYHHSATEVCHNGHTQIPGRFASCEGVNVRESALLQHHPPQQYVDPPILLPFSGHHGYTSNVSHNSSVVTRGSGSRHSGSQSQTSQHFISDINLLTVMNCLMHNKECEIPDCPCRQLQDRYNHLHAASVPLQQKKSPERKHRKPCEVPISSSTESDSDVPASCSRRPKRLKLNDEKKLHPHYHISNHSHHVGKTACSNVDSRRRSRSLSDLTPITETRETPTPMTGGIIKAGTPIYCGKILGEGDESTFLGPTKEELLQHTALTPLSQPCPLLLREISLSDNNIPVLCLNNCPLQLKTPSPMKSKGKLGKRSQLNSNKPPLQPLREVSNSTETDDSNTSSRSDSPAENETAKSSHSDNEERIGLVSQNIHLSSFHRGGSTSGYESETNTANASSLDPVYVRGHVSPASRRSSSPFETETTVSSDGAVIKTTEC